MFTTIREIRMNKCKDCKHFGDVVTYDDGINDKYDIETDFHISNKIEHIERYSHKAPSDAHAAHVVDGSDYYAALRVKDSFGCTEWEDES